MTPRATRARIEPGRWEHDPCSTARSARGTTEAQGRADEATLGQQRAVRTAAATAAP